MLHRAAFVLAGGLWAVALAQDGLRGWIDRTVLPPLVPEQSVEMRDNEGHLLRAYTVGTGLFRLGATPAEVDPLYLANPKPAALDNAMSYLLTGDQTATTQLITNDLGAAQVELQIWQPIVSNLIFVNVVLGISCLYIARKEF